MYIVIVTHLCYNKEYYKTCKNNKFNSYIVEQASIIQNSHKS